MGTQIGVWEVFSQFEWMCFAGAERFPNGAEPMSLKLDIDGESAVAVLDGQGISVFVGDEDEAWTARRGMDAFMVAALASGEITGRFGLALAGMIRTGGAL